MLYCKKCGTQLPDNAIFCMKCGTKVEIPSEIPPSIDSTTSVAPQKTQQPNVKTDKDETSLKPASHLPVFAVILFILLSVMGVAILHSQDKNTASQVTVSQEKQSKEELRAAKEKEEAEKKKAHEEAIKPPVTLNQIVITPDIIGQPQLTLSMTNNSEKDIDAYKVRIYAYDNYGTQLRQFGFGDDFLGGISQDILPSGASTSMEKIWLLHGFDNGRKFVLRLMSIHFTDGTEWRTEDNQQVTVEGTFSP